ncbi:carboxymuconolactone decarboxylase family protein [Pseudonocardia oroxyli]|jgi:AhpD family alkylhydroperoxidase|uniref:Alkylhydroperoxidase AhpD family core domain-containing protein n=1 Tax=Pseudonocardia oroxyli TaxID=366584 RepID=A0A1G8BM94_PSEOR|nr:carboxymuconolactone decarboxylase family protein [Pseudonocardia oroxyli]SDH34332.1 alkylhydroperoxidase AhpD family core domain-containing protein [Pseudonocardia oroxyli]
MARIPAVPESEAGVLGRFVYRLARKRFGLVPEPVAIARHHRGLFWSGLVAELALEKAATRLPARVREIAVYRTATVVGCAWCVDFGTMLQRLEGLDVERLRRIADFATDPTYTDAERLAIRYADAMTATPTTVTDAQVAELEAEFGRAGLLELTQVIAVENQRARANHALGIVDQGFDAACAVR